MVLSPKESGEFIVKNSKFVKVKSEGISKLAEEVLNGLKSKEVSMENFLQNEHHPKPEDENAANWIFIADTLNFCFWTKGNDTKWKIENNTGYFAMCAGINRAIKEGIDLTNPHFYSKITLAQLSHIFRGDDNATNVQLLEERVNCLHEVGKKLVEKYDGQFENCIKQCNKSAEKLLKLIVEEFPCFRDEADFAGQRVSIYKRAQILIGDIWCCFRGKGLGAFDDIQKITMFADYRIPQVLVYFGALEYTQELQDILKKDQILKNGDTYEVEIRGASIFIVEELKELVLEKIKAYPDISQATVNSILIDQFLWDYRRRCAKELEYIPFHKVYSIYY